MSSRAQLRLVRAAALACLLVEAALAEDAFLARQRSIRGVQPPDLELRLEAPKARFCLGETVPLSLTFSAARPGQFLADSRINDRAGRLNYVDEFRADPGSKVEDPLRGLPGESIGMGGPSGGPMPLGPEKPFVVERNLNEWVRFRSPGTYRVYVVSRRVWRAGGGAERIEASSNLLTLEIVAAPREWVAQQIASATAVLDRPAANEQASWRNRQRAGLTLRFLNTLESAEALARRLPVDNTVDVFALHSGILDSSHRARLLPLMTNLLEDSAFAVSERFLTTLSQLAVLVEAGGVQPPYPGDPAGQADWQAESRRRVALLSEKRELFLQRVVASLNRKDPAARAVTRDSLLQAGGMSPSPPPWLADVVRASVAALRTLPARMRANLLTAQWRLIRDADLLAMLLDLYASPPPEEPGFSGLEELVLKRIYELAPVRGRELILTELRRPMESRIGFGTLSLLPDETLPELDPIFAAQAARRGPLPQYLIARYASGAIVKEIEAGWQAFEAELDGQGLPHCPYPLVYYFLKFDPEFGEQQLRRAAKSARCSDFSQGIDLLGMHGMSLALERLAIEHLTSPKVPVKRSAATILGRYGTHAALKPLWETMEFFRAWWRDREESLQSAEGAESLSLERALVTALAQAGGWILDAGGYQRLLALCSSGECRARVQGWMREAADGRLVEIQSHGGGERVWLGAYGQVEKPQLPAKLAQFPAETAFRVLPSPEQSKADRERVEGLVRASGHRTVD